MASPKITERKYPGADPCSTVERVEIGMVALDLVGAARLIRRGERSVAADDAALDEKSPHWFVSEAYMVITPALRLANAGADVRVDLARAAEICIAGIESLQRRRGRP